MDGVLCTAKFLDFRPYTCVMWCNRERQAPEAFPRPSTLSKRKGNVYCTLRSFTCFSGTVRYLLLFPSGLNTFCCCPHFAADRSHALTASAASCGIRAWRHGDGAAAELGGVAGVEAQPRRYEVIRASLLATPSHPIYPMPFDPIDPFPPSSP